MVPPAYAQAIEVRVEALPYRPNFWHSRRADAAVAVGFLLVNAVLQVLDAGATWLGIRLGAAEANPVMGWLLSTPGPALFFFVKALVVLSLVAWAVWIAWRREASPAMLRGVEALAIAFAVVVALNVLTISRHIYGLSLG